MMWNDFQIDCCKLKIDGMREQTIREPNPMTLDSVNKLEPEEEKFREKPAPQFTDERLPDFILWGNSWVFLSVNFGQHNWAWILG